MPNEHVILCGPSKLSSREKRWTSVRPIRLDTDRKRGNVNLRISDINKAVVANMPDVATDLIELATYIYCADQATTRGGAREFEYGQKWRRQFRFEVPVRVPEMWSRPEVIEELKATLGFLSDDDYEFAFHKHPTPTPVDLYFEFANNIAASAGIEEVVLFSGGMDSFGGAVQEILRDRRNVALVSHRPVSKLDARQRQLVADLAAAARDMAKGSGKPVPVPCHVPVWINKDKPLGKEYTQRSRSFLYASLGAVVARLFGLNRVRFYENGIVSMNMPISPQAISGRASRTTHPQVLNGFGSLFSLLFGRTFTVENPFMWQTKADILNGIKALGFGKLCAYTSSCGHTWELTKLYTHCGRCSQCIDRRLVALAAGLSDEEDPPEMYRHDVLRGPRKKPEERILIESYVRTAGEIDAMTSAVQFCTRFGEVSRLVNHIDGTADDVAQRVFDLHKKHARQVLQALDAAAKGAVAEMREGTLPADSLLSIVYAGKRAMPEAEAAQSFPTPDGSRWEDVSLRFIDGETLSITVKDVSKRFLFSEMGMSDGRNKKPTKQWRLLESFAKERGYLDWDSSDADRRNQKRRENLARDLSQFFGIKEDPFVAEGNGWRARFSVDNGE